MNLRCPHCHTHQKSLTLYVMMNSYHQTEPIYDWIQPYTDDQFNEYNEYMNKIWCSGLMSAVIFMTAWWSSHMGAFYQTYGYAASFMIILYMICLYQKQSSQNGFDYQKARERNLQYTQKYSNSGYCAHCKIVFDSRNHYYQSINSRESFLNYLSHD